MTTPLAEKIKAIIRLNGPITITDYFALCLADPEYGYYKTRDPFGRGGDFITAPEISQLFGEMIGIFLIEAWRSHLKPQRNIRLCEIGPGRGSMMADILRVVEQLAPDLYSLSSVHLVETSPTLADIQKVSLARHEGKVSWHGGFDEIPDGFLLLVANEFFDAVPIRQFVKTEQGFKERLVGLDHDDNLIFAAGIGGIDPSLLPEGHRNAPTGTIAELAPARSAIMQALCEHLFKSGGTALILDYGYTETAFGDTLQAIFKHAYDPPLAHPGEADLTSHVDFSALAEIAAHCSVHVNDMMRQGDFLMQLGLGERAGVLGAGKDAQTQRSIVQAVRRLAGSGEGEMGDLFKVLAVSSPMLNLPPFQSRSGG